MTVCFFYIRTYILLLTSKNPYTIGKLFDQNMKTFTIIIVSAHSNRQKKLAEVL